MPQTPYARAILRINGGSPVTGAITCVAGDVVNFRLENTTSLRSVRWELHGYPPGWATPSGWTLDAESRVIYSDELEPDDITMPSGKWGKWLIYALVNGGGAPQLVDKTSALEIVSPNGLHGSPVDEEEQFGGAAEGWSKDHEANLRTIDGLLGAGGTGISAIDVAGSGNKTLSSGESASPFLDLVGVRTGNGNVTLDNQPGRFWMVRNSTTGPLLLFVFGPSGGSAILAPGQVKRLGVDADGLLVGEDLDIFRCKIGVSLIAGGAGNTDIALCAVPAFLDLRPVIVRTIRAPVGGGATVQIGTESGGAEVLATTAPGAAHERIGNLAAHLGSGVDDGGAFYFDAAGVLWMRVTADAAISAGSVQVRVLGEVE